MISKVGINSITVYWTRLEQLFIPVPPPVVVLCIHNDHQVGIHTHAPAQATGDHQHLKKVI